MLVFKHSRPAGRLVIGTAAFAFSFSASVFAQSAVPTVQDRQAVMRAQIALLQTEADLNKAMQDAAGSASSPLPQVVAVFGIDGDMVARLQMSNGLVSNFRAGETIRAGLTVSSITPRQVSVVIGKGKSVRVLPLEFFAAIPAGSGIGAGLPPGIPGMPVGQPGNTRQQPIPRELLPAPPEVRIPSLGSAPLTPGPASATPAAPVPPAAAPAPTPPVTIAK